MASLFFLCGWNQTLKPAASPYLFFCLFYKLVCACCTCEQWFLVCLVCFAILLSMFLERDLRRIACYVRNLARCMGEHTAHRVSQLIF
jgi:hypothetical protein